MGCMLSVFTAILTSGLYFLERFASFTLCAIMCCALLSAAGLSIAFGVALGYHYSMAEDILAKQKWANLKIQQKADQARGVGVTPAKGKPVPTDYGELVTQMSIAAATINATARRRRHNNSFNGDENRGNLATESFLKVTTTLPDLPFKLKIPPNMNETSDMQTDSKENTADISADKYDMTSNSKEDTADPWPDKYDMFLNSKEDAADVSPDKYGMSSNSIENAADAAPDKYDMIVNSPRKYGKMERGSMGRRGMNNSKGGQQPFIPAVNWWRGLNTTKPTVESSNSYDDEYKEYDEEEAEEEERHRLKRGKRDSDHNNAVMKWLHKYGGIFSRL